MTTTRPGVEQRANLAREFRTYTVNPIEVRSADNGNPHFIGDASMIDTPYTVRDAFGEFTETIVRGAFTKTLRDKADVRLLVNHTGVPLARTKSGTLSLSETPHLHAEAELDSSNPTVMEVRSAMHRGDLDQMSIGFRAVKDEWNADYTERRVTEAALFDVSVVTDPASPTTAASLRAQPVSAAPGTAHPNPSGSGASVGAPNSDIGSNANLGKVTGAVGIGNAAGVDSVGPASTPVMVDTPGMDNPNANPDIVAAIEKLRAGDNDLSVLVAAILAHYGAAGTGAGAPLDPNRSRRARRATTLPAMGAAAQNMITGGVDPAPLVQRLDMILDTADDVVDQLLAIYGVQDADDENNAVNNGQGAMPGSQMLAANNLAELRRAHWARRVI